MKRIPGRIVAISIVLVVIVLGFNGWLTVVSLEKNYIDSVAANYAVAGGETQRIIEYAVKYGKPLDNFYGMKELLAKTRNFAKELDDFRIINPDGQVLYSLQEGTVNTAISNKLKAQADGSVSLRNKNYIMVPEGSKYHIFMPLQNRDGHFIGSLAMVFDKSVIDRGISQFISVTFKTMIGLAFGAALVLIVLLRIIPVLDESGTIRRKRFLIIFVTVLATTQMVFGFINNSNFKEIYFDIVKKNTAITAEIVSHDINSVIDRGVPYSRLSGVGEWLAKVIRSVPELEGIYITDAQDDILYKAAVSNETNQTIAKDYKYEKPLMADGNGVSYKLTIVLSEAYLDKQVQELLLDIITVAFVSFFFMVEILVFILILLQVKVNDSKEESSETDTRAAVIRPLAFLFFLATDLSISFIPMQMKNLYQPIWGLSQNAVIGLPISVEMLCAGLMTIVTGAIIDKKGWRFPFFTGLAVVGTGAVLSGLAWNSSVFIIARGIVGIGYGFAWMAMRGYVALLPSAAARAKGFSGLSAGIYAGNICACSLGAMLAARLNYSGVFFVTVVVVLVVAVFALFFTKDNDQVKKVKAAEELPVKRGQWQNFLGDGTVSGLILLITIPSAMCLTGFLNYFFPLYSTSLGLSTANVGRAFMIYGVSIVYLGPLFSRYITNQSKFTMIIPVASGIGVLAMFVFFLNGGIMAALVAIFLFGVADSIGFIAQNTFLLSLPATKMLGQGTALGLFSMTKKLGQMLGPMMMAWGVGFGVTQAGVGAIGLLYLFAIIIFLMVTVARYKRTLGAPNLD